MKWCREPRWSPRVRPVCHGTFDQRRYPSRAPQSEKDQEARQSPLGTAWTPGRRGRPVLRDPLVTRLPQPRKGAHLAPEPPPAQPRLHTRREEPRPLLGAQRFRPRLLSSYVSQAATVGTHEVDVITPRPRRESRLAVTAVLLQRPRPQGTGGGEKGGVYFHFLTFHDQNATRSNRHQ